MASTQKWPGFAIISGLNATVALLSSSSPQVQDAEFDPLQDDFLRLSHVRACCR
uniref:Uncharacterized protein n=1 Tax=Arundo donax TaxID=35708 RepID=A0A0A9A3A5_ARUDO